LAVVVGGVSALLTLAIDRMSGALHVLLFGPGAAHGLSSIHDTSPWLLLAMPALGGLVLGGLNRLLAFYRSRALIDPIKANAVHGGRLPLDDGVVVATQNLISNGFGASVGLEAGYVQIASSAASRLGQFFRLRRADLRVLLGCGAAGSLAAAFDAPLTGTFYAFELVVGVYSIATLFPVAVSAVTATLVAGMLRNEAPLLTLAGTTTPDLQAHGLAVLLGLFCGLAGIALMRGVTLMEQGLRRSVPWPNLRPAVGGLGVGALALITPGVLFSGHGPLHQLFTMDTALGAAATLLVLKALASAISLGSGFRGSLFFASLLLGALMGQIFAGILALVSPPGLDAVFLITIGISAFAAAVIGGPLAMTFLAMEMTDNFSLTGAVMLAVVASSITARRFFGYSFSTWRFHLRGGMIRSAHHIGWVRNLTVGKLMRRNPRTVKAETSLSAFRRDFPPGRVSEVIAVNEANRYAGIVSVADANAESSDRLRTIAPLLRHATTPLLPAMNAKEAMAIFEATESEALAVIDNPGSYKVIGMLTEAELVRHYNEELESRRTGDLGT